MASKSIKQEFYNYLFDLEPEITAPLKLAVAAMKVENITSLEQGKQLLSHIANFRTYKADGRLWLKWQEHRINKRMEVIKLAYGDQSASLESAPS